MSEIEPPQVYLATPASFELTAFTPRLEAVLEAVPVACLRLALVSRDEDVLSRAADALRAIAHERDIPVVIDDHFRLAERCGLDGVHLLDGPRRLRDVRRQMGQDAIVGAFCGASRHAGMNAGELGADYVSFGPVTQPVLLDDGPAADAELFAWWSEMIEVPVVAEGGLTPEALKAIAPHTDFLGFCEEIWSAGPNAAATARDLYTAAVAAAGAV